MSRSSARRMPTRASCDIDVSAALALPGTQVFTAADVGLGAFQPPPFPGLDQRMGRPFLADEVVRFVGDIVAVVVTGSRAEGVDAAELVVVDYDPLPAAVDPEQALAGDPLLFPEAGTNICTSHPAERDESLFDGCDAVVSGRLVSQRLAACPLEPRSCAAVVGDDGRLTMWLSTQTPHQDRDALALILGLEPVADVASWRPTSAAVSAPRCSRRGDPGLLAGPPHGASGPLDRDPQREHGRDDHGRAAILDFTIGGSRDGAVEAYRLRILQDVGAYPRIAAVLPGFTCADGELACTRSRGSRASSPASSPTRRRSARSAVRAGRRRRRRSSGRWISSPPRSGSTPPRYGDAISSPPMPSPLYTASGAHYDCGDYERALDLALETAGYDALREEQRRRREQGDTVALGIGVSVYVEITNGLVEPEFGASRSRRTARPSSARAPSRTARGTRRRSR